MLIKIPGGEACWTIKQVKFIEQSLRTKWKPFWSLQKDNKECEKINNFMKRMELPRDYR